SSGRVRKRGMGSEKAIVVSAEEEVCMVEYIEELRQKLDARTLGDPEHSRDSQVLVLVSKSPECVAAVTRRPVVAGVAIVIGIAGGLSVDRAARRESRDRAQFPIVQNRLREPGKPPESRLGSPTQHESLALIGH